MKLEWRGRSTVYSNSDIILMRGRCYEAGLVSLTEDYFVLVVMDEDGRSCMRRYRSKDAVRREWRVVEGEL